MLSFFAEERDCLKSHVDADKAPYKFNTLEQYGSAKRTRRVSGYGVYNCRLACMLGVVQRQSSGSKETDS